MTTHVHKRLGGRKVQKFLHELKEEDEVTLSWKMGPFMHNTRLDAVRISHWPNRETIMFQGPDDAANKLNERFKTIMCDESDHEENMNENRQNNGRFDIAEEKPGFTSMREDQNSVTITRRQIDDILLFFRGWGYQLPRPEGNDANVNNRDTQQGTSIRNFK